MPTTTDTPSPYVTVPAGSPLRSDLAAAAEPTPDGLRLTATGCGVNDTHPGPFTWHRWTPADMGGQDTTNNLMDVCVECETAIDGYLDLMRPFGPAVLDEQMKALRREISTGSPGWQRTEAADRWVQMTMARKAFAMG